ncbi:MAG: transglycosylase SLT domain-containing protein [Candidatus Uhrbacteria bacterium]
MDKKGKPPEGAMEETTAVDDARRPPLTPPPYEEGKRRVSRKTVESAAAITAAAMGIAHAVIEVPKEGPTADESSEAKGEDAEHPEWKYNAVGEIVRETVFHDENSTGGVQDQYVSLFKTVFSSPKGTCVYYDTLGNVLLVDKMPDVLAQLAESIEKGAGTKKELDAMTKTWKDKVQAWHNANRKKISAVTVTPSDYDDKWAYPFVASPVLKNMPAESEATSLIEGIRERLVEKTKSPENGPSYFDGAERSIYDGISEIAKAYDIPLAIALGIAANESTFNRTAHSDAGANGIYQVTEKGFGDAKAYIAKHPELGAAVRSGSIGSYEDSWKDRFVSAELCCAYYLLIQGRMRKKLDALETRLLTLDPTFPVGTFLDIATINSYNAGDGRMRDCIDRFLSLSDDEIVAHIGDPEYGADVWLGVVGLSYGLTDDGKFSNVGKDSFLYPQKILAMGSLIMDAQNAMSAVDRDREDEGVDAGDFVPDSATRRGFWRNLSVATGIAGVLGGIFSGNGAVRDIRSEPLNTSVSRRNLLKGTAKATAAVIGVTSPVIRAGADWLDSRPVTETPPEVPPVSPEQPYAPVELEPLKDVEAAATVSLDAVYETLLERAAQKKTGWTPEESKRNNNLFPVPENRRMLKERFIAMFGKDLVKKFKASEGDTFESRAHLYDEARAQQVAYIERQVSTGSFVRLAEDDPTKPYFCEQVDSLSGIKNNPDGLFLRKEFIPVIGTLIELVNYQIDKFNANNLYYGIHGDSFPTLPYISALKISGALRSTLTTKGQFASGKGKDTTPGMTPHWLGSAMDISSFATVPHKDKKSGKMVGPMGHMARLDGDLLAKKGGRVIVRRGEKLNNGGDGATTRDILTHMIGRALFAMRDPLMELYGIEIQPKWENPAKNWHVALEAKDAK